MSCLFNSLGYFINKNGEKLRNEICDYLSSNPVFIDDGTKIGDLIETGNEVANNLDEYVSKMRNKNQGGNIEIFSFCNIYKIPVIVEMTDKLIKKGGKKNIEHFPLTKTNKSPIKILWNGGHYTPIKN
jgi:hypothetical protein